MRCPSCSGVEDKFIESRPNRDGSAIRRRRECIHCSHRFTTYEQIEEFIPVIIKKDGSRETLKPEKILSGLRKACEKRPVPTEEIDAIKDSIVQEIQSRGEKEVPSSFVGECIMNKLHDLDPVAYVRFASVYRDFKDVNEFMSEIHGLIKKNRK
jgi:transcriptional repressor NrdR